MKGGEIASHKGFTIILTAMIFRFLFCVTVALFPLSQHKFPEMIIVGHQHFLIYILQFLRLQREETFSSLWQQTLKQNESTKETREG